jgi:hypothetical protein
LSKSGNSYGSENRVNILKKEMRHLTWRDIDFRTQALRVTRKPLHGFKLKMGQHATD